MKLFNWQFLIKNKPITDIGSKDQLTKFSFGHLLFGLIIFVVSAHLAVADSHPNMYLNQEEIDAIKIKVELNVEPWASAYSKVKSAADTAMKQVKLESVTYQGPVKASKNLYFTEPPYCGWPTEPFCRDGEISGNADRGDYEAAIRLGDVVRDLGLAYVFTGEAKYAEKVIDFIRIWSLDADTHMRPIPGNRIETYITFPGYFYGADLIWNYDGWDPAEKTDFQTWVEAMGDYVFANGEGNNNFSNWRVVMLASAGALLDDASYLTLAESEWKRLLPIQMNGSGSSKAGQLGQEVGRTKGLHYSMYALNAMIQGAEILRHRNVNLYDYKDGQGRGLELALDFITPYAIDPAIWGTDTQTRGYQQITPITQKDSMALFELAYSHYQKPSYLAAVNRWGRPMDEIRIMGINTLTHANRFDLNTAPIEPTPPSIVTQPESVTVTEGEDASFSIVAIGSDPLSYQWFRDGSAIADATNASYVLTNVSSSDNARVYSSEVNNSLGTVSSSGAVLTVLSDAIAPTLASVFAASDTGVEILFSEPVDVGSAEDNTNYQIDLGIAVISANLNGDGRTISLGVSPLTEDTNYTVQVSNVQDRAQTPNTIVAQSSKSFTYRTADGFEEGSAEGWTPLTASRWSVVMDEGDRVYYLNTTSFNNLEVGRLGEYSLLSAEPGDFTFTLQAKLSDDLGSNLFADYAVIFGFQDENNYYYAMFNNTESATQLAKVVDGSRTEFATAETDWLSDNLYHSVEVSRIGSDISVRFDGNLIMSASDSTFGAGKVGVGSYNDSAYFDDVSLVAAQTSDTVAPLITLTGDNPQMITVGSVYGELGATAIDNRDGNISTNITIDASAVDTTTVGSYNVSYNVSDAAGNPAIKVTRSVNITAMADSVIPVITLIGNNPQTITVGSTYPELGASASDNVDGNISANLTIDVSAVNTSTVGSYNVRYNISDAAGNPAIEITRSVNVIAATVNEPDNSDGGGGSFGPLLGLGFMLLILRHHRKHNTPNVMKLLRAYS